MNYDRKRYTKVTSHNNGAIVLGEQHAKWHIYRPSVVRWAKRAVAKKERSNVKREIMQVRAEFNF